MESEKISVRKIGNLPVWHLSTSSPTTLAMTFVRMQEYYESGSKQFCGKIFTLDAYKEWYASQHGAWTYAEDWGGFNVPGDAVRTVYRSFPDHSKEEKLLFRKLEKLGLFKQERFCLIGTRENDTVTLRHELRHALYAIDDAYRRDIDAVLKRFPTHSFSRFLKKMGYGKHVIWDEKQAYALTGWPSRLLVTKKLRRLKKALRKVEKKYLHLLPACS